MTTEQLDKQYEEIAGKIADLIAEAVANRHQLDALLMRENEKETGLRQAPRSKDHFEEMVMKDLPF